MIERADIAAEARTWVGTPWHHQACLKGVGVDCIGLIVGVAKAFGIPEAAAFLTDPETRGYARSPNPEKLLAAADRFLERIPVGDARTGDILLMRPPRGTEPQHFGIISGEDPQYMIHAYAQARKVVEHQIDKAWRMSIIRAYRYRGVAWRP